MNLITRVEHSSCDYDDRDVRERSALDDHDAIMTSIAVPVLQREAPLMVHKTKWDAKVYRSISRAHDIDPGDVLDANNGDEAPLSDEQMDIICAFVAQEIMGIRSEYEDAIDAAVAPLKERIASLEGSIQMLMSLISGNGNRSIESSEVIRKLRVSS
jgi:hypothetical protein